jgi:hypothetical protein
MRRVRRKEEEGQERKEWEPKGGPVNQWGDDWRRTEEWNIQKGRQEIRGRRSETLERVGRSKRESKWKIGRVGRRKRSWSREGSTAGLDIVSGV